MSISDGKNIYNTSEEMFDAWHEEFKKEDPIGYWIDNILFNGKSLGHYAPHYSLTHPWVLIKDGFYALQQAWERVIKGWDYTACWAVDHYLAKQIPQILRSLNDGRIKGTSWDYFDEDVKGREPTEEEWNKASKKFSETLELIAQGFDAYIIIDKEMLWEKDKDPEKVKRYFEMKEKFNKGMELFVKYFHTLGD
jgi:hypothetical protein